MTDKKYSNKAFILLAEQNLFNGPQKPTDGDKKKKKKKNVSRYLTVEELKKIAEKLKEKDNGHSS